MLFTHSRSAFVFMSSNDWEFLTLSASVFFIFSRCNLNASRLKIPINLNPISTDKSSSSPAAHHKLQTAADDESYRDVGQ